MMNKGYTCLIILLTLSVALGSCEEEGYEKYLEGGEIYYPGKLENAFVFSGKNRVRLYGHFISDPKVVNCIVYWNVRQDSMIFAVNRVNIIDTLSQIVEIEEGIHNFEFFTMDAEGNRSVPVNRTGQSYGDKFQAQLSNRPFRDTVYRQASDSLMIAWGTMDETTGAYETEIQYNLGSGNAVSLRVPIDTDTTYIADYDGTGFKYRTFFRPEPWSIDNFWTNFSE